MTSTRAPKKKITKSYSALQLSKEFAENTSMHGLKFIAQDKASLLERILWVVLFIVGLVFALFFSWNLWENWRLSPVLITIQTANYPITNYPFPTVTVCSVNKVSTRALRHWMTTPEAKHFKLNEIRRILEIMSTNRVEDEIEVLTLSRLLLQANITSNDRKYEQLMDALSPNCSDMIIYCSWEAKEQDCKDLFETEATDDGFCCSFNSIVIRRDAKTNSDKQLRHARSSGVYAGLSVILNAELDDYNVTSSTINGFKVSIQDPSDFARTGRIGFLASPGFQIDAAVTGQTQIGDDKLRVIDLDKRLCTTRREIDLKYFADYTGPYCQLDCLTQLFLSECLCVPYYYPVPQELPVCNLSSYSCLERISEYVARNSSACFCPDVCTTVWYRNEISSGTYPNPASVYPHTVTKRSEFIRWDVHELNNYAKNNFVKLNVYLKSVSGLCYIMDERTTWSDFISATGGLLGLGFGFSILSAAELLYFFLLRWCYYWYQSKKKEQNLVHVQPSYPALIQTDFEGSVTKLPSQNRARVKAHLRARIPPSLDTFNRQSYSNNWDYYNDRSNTIQAWVDY